MKEYIRRSWNLKEYVPVHTYTKIKNENLMVYSLTYSICFCSSILHGIFIGKHLLKKNLSRIPTELKMHNKSQ